jgi:integrase
LPRGLLAVETGKTHASSRVVDVSPMLRDELLAHKARSRRAEPDDLVFATGRGTRQNRSNVTRRVLAPAVARANAKLAEQGKPPIVGCTNHSLPRTFCSLLYEAGASPGYVMAQLGHTSPALALDIYAKVMERKRDTGQRMDDLIRAADWDKGTGMGTNGSGPDSLLSVPETKSPLSGGF